MMCQETFTEEEKILAIQYIEHFFNERSIEIDSVKCHFSLKSNIDNAEKCNYIVIESQGHKFRSIVNREDLKNLSNIIKNNKWRFSNCHTLYSFKNMMKNIKKDKQSVMKWMKNKKLIS